MGWLTFILRTVNAVYLDMPQKPNILSEISLLNPVMTALATIMTDIESAVQIYANLRINRTKLPLHNSLIFALYPNDSSGANVLLLHHSKR